MIFFASVFHIDLLVDHCWRAESRCDCRFPGASSNTRASSSGCRAGRTSCASSGAGHNPVYPVWFPVGSEEALLLFILIQTAGKMGESAVLNWWVTDWAIWCVTPGRNILIWPKRCKAPKKEEMEKINAGKKAKQRTKNRYVGNVSTPSGGRLLPGELNCCIFFALRSVKWNAIVKIRSISTGHLPINTHLQTPAGNEFTNTNIKSQSLWNVGKSRNRPLFFIRSWIIPLGVVL